MAQKTTLEEFEAVFPKLEAVLAEHAKSYALPQKELDWYRQVWGCYICYNSLIRNED